MVCMRSFFVQDSQPMAPVGQGKKFDLIWFDSFPIGHHLVDLRQII